MRESNKNGGKNTIRDNLITEADLSEIDASRDHVTLRPEATIYRGYQKQFIHADTQEIYSWDPKRTLFFGSLEHAMRYSDRDDSEDKRFGGDGPSNFGPLYRFWAKRPLKLLSMNKKNAQSLIKEFIADGDYLNAGRLAVAYGYLWSLREGEEIIKNLQQTDGSLTGEERETFNEVIRRLEGRIGSALEKCLQECLQKGLSKKRSQQALDNELESFCRAECLEGWDTMGRTSFYNIDKPLIERLRDLLVPRGYKGIFAKVDHDYSKAPHDIIIFDFARNVTSDNVNVLKECPESKYLEADCPRMAKPIELTPPKLTRGPVRGRLPEDWDSELLSSESWIAYQKKQHERTIGGRGTGRAAGGRGSRGRGASRGASRGRGAGSRAGGRGTGRGRSKVRGARPVGAGRGLKSERPGF